MQPYYILLRWYLNTPSKKSHSNYVETVPHDQADLGLLRLRILSSNVCSRDFKSVLVNNFCNTAMQQWYTMGTKNKSHQQYVEANCAAIDPTSTL
jgi:hypothetical protein